MADSHDMYYRHYYHSGVDLGWKGASTLFKTFLLI